MANLTYPAWFNSPEGDESKIFDAPEAVPAGWTSGAEKIAAEVEKPAKTTKAKSAPLDL